MSIRKVLIVLLFVKANDWIFRLVPILWDKCKRSTKGYPMQMEGCRIGERELLRYSYRKINDILKKEGKHLNIKSFPPLTLLICSRNTNCSNAIWFWILDSSWRLTLVIATSSLSTREMDNRAKRCFWVTNLLGLWPPSMSNLWLAKMLGALNR